MVLKRWMILVLLLAACSPDRPDDEFFAPGGAGIPVVDAVLVVGKPYPDVYVTETLLPNQPFSYEAAGVLGATVTITGDGRTVAYSSILNVPGQYIPAGIPFGIRPATTYHLTVVMPDGRVVTAETTTPGDLQVRDWVLLNDTGTSVLDTLATFGDFSNNPDTLYTLNQLYFNEGLLEVRLEPQPAVGYLVGLQSLETDSELLIDTSFLNEEDLKNFTRTNQSPPFAANQDFIRAPWFAIYYEGRYKVRVFKMDRNWYDLARTDPVLGAGGYGFGGEAGDNTVPPLFHVNGGVGLFGSMASDSIGFYVNPPR